MVGRQTMLKDDGHEFFNHGVLLSGELWRISWGSVAGVRSNRLLFEVFGEVKDFLFGEQAFS